MIIQTAAILWAFTALASRAEASGNQDAAIEALFKIRQPMLERYISQALVMSEIDRLRVAGAQARAWMQLALSDRRATVVERAVARGDTLAELDAPNRLELAQDYYRFADSESHQQQVRAKAKKPGDTSMSRNHYTTASEYYQIAGLDDLADEVLERGEAEEEAAESGRQERFKQKQDDLESELDF